MSIFVDTSVLIASVRTSDQRHAASFKLVSECRPEKAACAAHSIAELYASLTGMNPPNRVHPRHTLQILEAFRSKFRWVELSADEVLETAQEIAGLGLLGGIIYDALLLKCARKAYVDRIYTWDVRDFQRAAPDLADRIVTP